MKLRKTENIFILGLFLAVTGLISAAALATVSNLTSPAIAAAKKKQTAALLQRLSLPGFNNNPAENICTFTADDGGEVSYMGATMDGKLVGIAARTSVTGYAGTIKVMAGMDLEGRILAVIVEEHKETPGLGANVCERKFQRSIRQFTNPHPDRLPANPILDQFHGRRADGGKAWAVKTDGGEFEYRTGATVTSRAITGAVSRMAELCRKQHRQITAKLSGAEK